MTPIDFERVALTDVSRHYGRRRALSHVTLTCRAGRVIGLLGPNGSGKSTLLSILATLVAPSAGDVRYGDVTARGGGRALRGRIGLLAHDLYLYPELSARENLAFFAGLHGLRPVDRHVAAALERAALVDRADDPVGEFSRGMRQRLALERALVHDPRLVLLDEPFTGLDEPSARALVARIRDLRDRGRIIVLATHDVALAAELMDDVVRLRDGRVENAEFGIRNPE